MIKIVQFLCHRGINDHKEDAWYKKSDNKKKPFTLFSYNMWIEKYKY